MAEVEAKMTQDSETVASDQVDAPVASAEAVVTEETAKAENKAEDKTEDADAKLETEEDKPAPSLIRSGQQEANDDDAENREGEDGEDAEEVTKPQAKEDENTGNGDSDQTENINSKASILNPPKNMLRVGKPPADGGSRFDPSVLEKSSDASQIRAQVHFYFNDSNLSADKFLKELTGGTENKPAPLSTICSFKRMRRFEPYSAVVTALKESEFLIVEGEEGKETVRRKKAFDPKKNPNRDQNSIYVKGFGPEQSSTQFDIEAFFSKFGTFNAVRLRRGDDGGFKGSVFVEWADRKTAENFMALELPPQFKAGHDMLIIWKSDYVAQKNDEIRKGNLKPHDSSSSNGRGRGGNRGRSDGRGRPNGNKSDNWKQRRDQDQKNGFNDRDRRDGRGRGRGRGPRGRGRGGSDRNQERQVKPTEDERPRINVTKKPEQTSPKTAGTNGNGKRVCDEDAGGEPSSKKIDTKGTVAKPAAEASS